MNTSDSIAVACSHPYQVRFVGSLEIASTIESKFAVLVDENVFALWPQLFSRCKLIHVVPEGEVSKSFAELESALRDLARWGCLRSDAIAVVGGGVTGDLGGLVASTYMRGINLVHIPTTLLAMVDSSVGGKTAIDLPEGKNLVGSFHQPSEVLVCLDFLSTLPGTHIRNGMAELIKIAYAVEPTILPLNRSGEISAELIRAAIEAKARVVGDDEFDTTGRRASLNFGHTFGHAIESESEYALLHGEAVSVGMVLEARLGERLGVSEPGLTQAITEDLSFAGLPTAFPMGMRGENLMNRLRSDKKADARGLAFSLVTSIGECKLFSGVPASEVRAVVDEVAQSSN